MAEPSLVAAVIIMLIFVIAIFLMVLTVCCSFMTWDGDTEGCGCCTVRREDNRSDSEVEMAMSV
ncbi:hypothetical protein PG993_013011 [Apiospora rasikravindrae]|uniref:Uncharacterized protein n=1 Tax=Apiospora rasikravindrae TaxID=990691 RepID=A0ABR1RWE7_9PEZI